MRALHAVLICLVIFAIFNYTAATLGPVIEQHNNLILKGKVALRSSPNADTPKEEPTLIGLGDAVYDPKPH